MQEKINCLLDKYRNINVRIYKLQSKANEIKNMIKKEAEIECRQNAAEQLRELAEERMLKQSNKGK